MATASWEVVGYQKFGAAVKYTVELTAPDGRVTRREGAFPSDTAAAALRATFDAWRDEYAVAPAADPLGLIGQRGEIPA